MKFSVVATLAACMVSSTYAFPKCDSVHVDIYSGTGCQNHMTSTTVTEDGTCKSLTYGSIKAKLSGQTLTGHIYASKDCNGAPLETVSTTKENTCIDGKGRKGSVKLYCPHA
eukprot:CFRG7845T1